MHLLLFTSGVLMLLFAFKQLVTRDKQPLHYFMAIACLGLGYVLLHTWLMETGRIAHLPKPFAASDIPAVFMTAPAFYLTSRTILRGRPDGLRADALYIIPPLLFGVGFTVYNAAADPAYLSTEELRVGHVGNPVLGPMAAAAYGAVVFAFVASLVTAYLIYRSEDTRNRKGFAAQVIFLCAYSVAAIPVLTGIFLGDPQIITLGLAVGGGIAAVFTLTVTSIVYFSLDTAVVDARKARARPEWNDTADGLSDRLARLMAGSAPYLDPDLTLPRLAELLGEEPKRLSYHFNVILSTNFRSYVNDLRLEAVCRGLIDDPDTSILDTAFAYGFNSKSSFNTLFRKKYGVTPSDFRAGKRRPAAQRAEFPVAGGDFPYCGGAETASTIQR